MKILVTGSSGFVGGAYGRLAAAKGHTLLGLSLDDRPGAGWPGEHRSVDLAKVDAAGIIDEFDPDIIFHAAGPASVPDSITNPLADFVGAALVWSRLLDAVRRSNADPLVVYPSSAAVYGNAAHLPVSENTPIRPISPYGFHKAACELVAAEYNQCFEVKVMVCRLFSLFGPTQRRLLVWELYKQFVSVDSVVLQGTGRETRDYLFIGEAAEAMLRLSELRVEATDLLAVNIASGSETRVLDLAGEIGKLTNRPDKDIVCGGVARPGDPLAWRADITLLRSLLPGWGTQSVVSTLGECIGQWQNERSDLTDQAVGGLEPGT